MSQNDTDQQEAVTPPVVRLAAAEVDVAAAKDRLNDTTARLQAKLDPKLLAREATDQARRVGDKGAAFARDNQSVLGGLAGGVLLYVIGRPLLRLIFRRRKYPKPQKAAKPMTATAPNERLARSSHPAQSPEPVASPPIPVPPAAELTPKPPLAPAHPSTNVAPPAPNSQSNEGAQLQGTTA